MICLSHTMCGDKYMINEDAVKEMLNGINMGMISIDYIEDKIKDSKLRALILKQRKDYGELKNRIRADYPEVEDVLRQKFMVETMLTFKSMLSDDKKIAKMMIEGCNQGIMTMNELLNHEDLSLRLKHHIDTLIQLSHYYLNEYKAFL